MCAALLRGDTGSGNGWTVFQGGGTSHTAILNSNFQWTAGPDIPNGYVMADAPAALETRGTVLLMTSPYRAPPSAFYELTPDPANALVPVAAPTALTQLQSSYGQFLVLPTGQILFRNDYRSGSTGQVWIYTPNNMTPNPAWAPKLAAKCFTCRVYNNHTNQWFGQQFSGVSQGSAYGDEFQSNENYGLVRITQTNPQIAGPPGVPTPLSLSTPAPPKVYYCRTYDFSSMGVATGSLSVSLKFDCPNLPLGMVGYLEVVANGIPSGKQLVQIYR